MKKLFSALAIGFALMGGAALAVIISPNPFTLLNGQTADANQVMSNFNNILTGVNTNAAHNGSNSDITALTGLTTPIPYSEGGTGTNTSTPVIPWSKGNGSTGDAQSAIYSPANGALFDGLILGLRVSGTNATATPTFSPDGLTTHVITKSGGASLAAGDLKPAGEVLLRYNLASTEWEFLNPPVPSNVVQTTRVISTPAGSGLAGGGALSSDLSLSLEISGLTTSSNPSQTSTFLAAYDNVSNANFKVPVSSLGKLLQYSTALSSTYDNTTSTLPYDNTTPQNSEGKEFITLIFTPVSASSTLKISVIAYLYNGNADVYSVALFKDSGADAVMAFAGGSAGFGSVTMPVTGVYYEASGSTTARTYHMRYGTNGAGTAYINGNSGEAKFNGLMKSGIIIEELR